MQSGFLFHFLEFVLSFRSILHYLRSHFVDPGDVIGCRAPHETLFVCRKVAVLKGAAVAGGLGLGGGAAGAGPGHAGAAAVV